MKTNATKTISDRTVWKFVDVKMETAITYLGNVNVTLDIWDHCKYLIRVYYQSYALEPVGANLYTISRLTSLINAGVPEIQLFSLQFVLSFP